MGDGFILGFCRAGANVGESLSSVTGEAEGVCELLSV